MKKVITYINKFLTLFLFIYFVLYTMSCQFFLTFLIESIWQIVIPKFAKFIGHKSPITVFANGSGDTTYNYYQILFFLVSAIILAILISFFFKKCSSISKLKTWLIIILRYYLAVQMIDYGLSKIFCLQFPYPNAIRLEQEVGDISPMGLLWTFMGYSRGYSIFTGILELLGGILLLNRRTLTLGALLTFGVMLNVMMLNYCYDVPVKLLSTHMVIMALYLISTDINRIFNFFFVNRIVNPRISENIVPEKFIRVKQLIKLIAITIYLVYSIYQANELNKKYGPNSPKPIFNGKYIVEVAKVVSTKNNFNDESKSNISEWKSILQGRNGYATIKTKLNEEQYFNLEADTSKKTIKLKLSNDLEFEELKYNPMNENRFHLYGNYKEDSVSILIRKEDKTLVGRKFNWINEYPFNR